MTIAEELAEMPLVDQHCHEVVLDPLDPESFASLLTEARHRGRAQLDTQVGLAVRRWCAPVLGLEAHAEPAAYLARRAELGPREASRLLLRACGVGELLVDTGLSWPGLCSLGELGALAGAHARVVTRIEHVVEQLAEIGCRADELGSAIGQALAERASRSVAFKTVAAYRVGLDLPDTAPTATEVRRAAGRWFRDCERTGRVRLDDPTLVAHAVWCCVPLGLPLQVHTGFGDSELTLHWSDPSRLTPLLRALPAGPPVVLLHCYPYHRQAAYLASVFPQVALDVSLAVSHVGPRASVVLAETLELAPFGSVLYASDGFGLAELHHLGAVLFRDALGRLLDGWLVDDVLSLSDARRFAEMIAAGNARRIYRLATP